MKKIMFSDKYGLTQAVLEGRKTQTRRIITPQPTYSGNVGICWKGYAYGINCSGTEGAYNNFITGTEYDKSCKRYRVGEIVAIAQSYKDVSEGGYPVDSRYDLFRKENWDEDKREYGKLKTHNGWTNKMFVKSELMPHQIKITNVRVERLQDISDEDCLAEGIIKIISDDGTPRYYVKDWKGDTMLATYTPQKAYAFLIDKVGKKGDWEKNPYVFVYDFELVK